MTDFAGTLRERVEWWTPTPARDALAGEGGDWTLAGTIWAAVSPDGQGPAVEGDSLAALPRWRLVMPPCAVAVGDRIGRAAAMLAVRSVVADPALPDRIAVTAEALR